MTGNEGVDDPVGARSLLELFEKDTKRFEWLAKQYYDLFAYHAAQRLTAFNFFLVSLSFFSTAYATLITRSDTSAGSFFPVAAALASAAFLLVVAFGRLDRRNEQIISINEKPLIRIQRTIRLGLALEGEIGDEVWETFVKADRSHPLRTFGDLLPFIYTLAASASAAGAIYGVTGPGPEVNWCWVAAWFALTVIASLLIYFPMLPARTGTEASEEAAKVVRPVISAPAAAEPSPALEPQPAAGTVQAADDASEEKKARRSAEG